MRRFLRRRRAAYLAAVSFCERCGTVCDPGCRADALLERARAGAFTFQAGWR